MRAHTYAQDSTLALTRSFTTASTPTFRRCPGSRGRVRSRGCRPFGRCQRYGSATRALGLNRPARQQGAGALSRTITPRRLAVLAPDACTGRVATSPSSVDSGRAVK
eukprot:6213797-Pleurochrysis_carterae.AAC.3